MSDLILYTTDDGRSQIKLRVQDQTVWLTQKETSQLFDVSTDNVGLHLKNLFAARELEEKSVAEESSVTAADGKNYRTKLYNLDAVLAVGYRVRSPRGLQFRRWASTILKEYLVKGFVMDDERLKNPDGRPDYFDELLERIRNIRAAEKRFYQKVRAKQKQETRMAFWKQNVDQIITSNGFPLLTHPGSVRHEQMEQRTEKLYLDFDEQRKKQEALAADQQDEADLKVLEAKLKRRPKK